MSLPDLDAIDWASFEHAYGPANDVPEMLRGMLDPKRRNKAFADFDASVNHQGWASPAAVPCMAWLVAALEEPDAPLAPLIRRLADLAVLGNHESWIADRMQVAPEPALHDPVLGAHATFVRHLGHEDPDVRACAALALAVLPEKRDDALGPLTDALAGERKAAVKASMILALGVLGGPEQLDAVEAAASGKRVAKPVRIATAAARIWLRPQAIEDDDLLELLAGASATATAKGLPWADGDLAFISSAVVMRSLATQVASDRVIELLKLVDESVKPDVVGTLVKQAFGEEGLSLARPDDLSDLQRTALQLGAEVKLQYWLTDLFGAAGLPTQPRGIRVFLGLEEGGVLDRAIDVGGHKTPLWRAMRGALRDEVDAIDLARAVADQLGLDDTLEAVDELLEEKHHYPDVVLHSPNAIFSHEDRADTPRPHERMARLIAELLRPHGDALEPIAEARLEPLLAKEYPGNLEPVLWLTVLARCGPLDPKYDALVANRVAAPPASRSPMLLGEILQTLPVDRRDAIVLEYPLMNFSAAVTKRGDEVIFEWRSAWGGEGWWYLWSCPSAAALEAVVDAVRAWSNLPPLPDPDTIPRGCHASPHAPFPFRRAEETFAHWDRAIIRARLERLVGDDDYDPEIVSRLLAMVA